MQAVIEPLVQQIQNERNEIKIEGANLAEQKEQHHTDFTPIPILFIFNLLRLVRQIAQHDIAHRANYGNAVETAQRRKANLGNLALTLKLFDNSSRLMEYDVTSFYKAPGNLQGYINTNLFDDMKYLATYQGLATTNPLIELRAIPDAAVANILNAVCPIFVEIANREIQAIQIRQGPRLFRQGLPADVALTRNIYRNHRTTTELYYFIMFEKETRKLARALRAIQDTQVMAVDNASPLANKRAFLKCLVVIGEAFTQSNLTPQSRSLSNLAQPDLQLFKNLRNKIADSQYDLHPEHVEAYIAANSLEAIKAELVILTPQLTAIRTQLQVRQQNNQLAAFYPDDKLGPAPQYAYDRFVNTRAFFNALPQTANTYRQDKANHPNDFTPANIAQKTQNEIDQITALTHGIPGENSLADPRNENQQLIAGDDVVAFLIRVAQVNANNDAELNQAIVTIRALSPQVHPGRLVVEFPINILAPYFPAQQYPNGFSVNDINIPFIQNHMAALSPSIKRYARRLDFVNHLNTNPICKNAIEYHFGRMARFLMEIPDRGIEQHIGADNLAQWRVIRNVIQHDLEELETYGFKASQLLCHYLGIVIQNLPNMLQAFAGVALAPGIP